MYPNDRAVLCCARLTLGSVTDTGPPPSFFYCFLNGVLSYVSNLSCFYRGTRIASSFRRVLRVEFGGAFLVIRSNYSSVSSFIAQKQAKLIHHPRSTPYPTRRRIHG